MRAAALRAPVQPVMTIPEQLFRLGPLEFDADRVRGTMITGPWLRGSAASDGQGHAGTLAVLVDDVLGYAINAVTGSWSISTEIGLDIVAPVPVDGSTLYAESSVMHIDAVGGLAHGVVRNEAGDTIAHCYQRGRWVDGIPPTETGTRRPVAPTESTEAESLQALLGEAVRATGAGVSVDVVPRVANPLGNLHGGISLCVAEWLAASTLPFPGTTASIRAYYIRGVPLGDSVLATPMIQHKGRTYGVVQVTASTPTGKPATITTVTRH